jgi:divalent metal cation (Fe/Co/Zn/Cd) transporter
MASEARRICAHAFSGDRTFIEYRVEVERRLPVERGHAIGDATERAVENLLPGTVETMAHITPFGIDDERLDERTSAQPQ